MNTLTTYEAITKTATSDRQFRTNIARAKFHYFNPNGLNAKHRSMSDTIAQYVNDNIVTTGWHLAYGSLNYFYTERIAKLGTQRAVNGIKLSTTLEGLQDQIDKGYTKLGEFILSDEPTAAEKRAAAKELI